MDSFADNRDLAELIASRLTGQPVTLRMRAPIYQHAKGMTMKVKGNGFFIDIEPGRPPLDQLRTYYHEVAHVYMSHFAESTAVEGLDQLPPRLFTRHSESKPYSEKDRRQELEADVLGNTWYTYAEKHYDHFGSDSIQHRLMTLLEWAN